ncbi:MAG: hypothetical protein JW713_06530 [Pontiellaceae bacterium]|nr:hypothetical protein [Pontiellaceae bacterium]
MVIAAARAELSGGILDGGIETDSAMLVCDSATTALSIARRLYQWSFQNARMPSAKRLWLRGSVVPYDDSSFIRHEAVANEPLSNVKVYTYSAASLDAISVEKSGFKGMRLLVRAEVLDNETRKNIRIPLLDGYSLVPVRRLRHIGYPMILEGELLDYLWMATGDEADWQDTSIHMTSRLRHSAKDSEEFAQAAATQVLFHECAAITQSVRSRAKRAKTKQQMANQKLQPTVKTPVESGSQQGTEDEL